MPPHMFLCEAKELCGVATLARYRFPCGETGLFSVILGFPQSALLRAQLERLAGLRNLARARAEGCRWRNVDGIFQRLLQVLLIFVEKVLVGGTCFSVATGWGME